MPYIRSLPSAWLDGWFAHKAGFSGGLNPYDIQLQNGSWHRWNNGWCDRKERQLAGEPLSYDDYDQLGEKMPFDPQEPVANLPAINAERMQDRLFAFLNRRYVQRADSRQRAMGLQYMEAETHGLAEDIVRWFAAEGKGNADGWADGA